MGTNTVYVSYCAAHGKTPEEMLEHDSEKYPGGTMTGYVLWVEKRKKEFLADHPEHELFGKIANLDAWSFYLNKRFIINKEKVE
jgi:hypothetical protein